MQAEPFHVIGSDESGLQSALILAGLFGLVFVPIPVLDRGEGSASFVRTKYKEIEYRPKVENSLSFSHRAHGFL